MEVCMWEPKEIKFLKIQPSQKQSEGISSIVLSSTINLEPRSDARYAVALVTKTIRGLGEEQTQVHREL